MTDYFGYDVHFVMNITDIDDKVHYFFIALYTSRPFLADHQARAAKPPP
jgi:cysteinyl-tRNA synthetase